MKIEEGRNKEGRNKEENTQNFCNHIKVGFLNSFFPLSIFNFPSLDMV